MYIQINACIANVPIESLFCLASFAIINDGLFSVDSDGLFSVDGALTIGGFSFSFIALKTEEHSTYMPYSKKLWQIRTHNTFGGENIYELSIYTR